MRMGVCQTRREQCCLKQQADLACDRAAKPIVSPFEVSHKRKTPHSKRSAVRKNSADRRLIFSESLPWTREWNPIRTNWNDFSGQTLRMRTYSLSISRLFFFPPILCRQFCDREIFTDDMVEWTSWAYSFQDPDLFPNDIHKNYWMTNFPLGYAADTQSSIPIFGRRAARKASGVRLGWVVDLSSLRSRATNYRRQSLGRNSKRYICFSLSVHHVPAIHVYCPGSGRPSARLCLTDRAPGGYIGSTT